MTLSRIALELTNRCNLSCRHCLRELVATPTDFGVELLDRVLGQAREHYGLHQVVFTGGEPLMHPELERVLAVVDRHGFTFSMVTNGHLVPKRLKLLSSAEVSQRVGQIAVSLDGPDAAVHDGVRGPGAYRKAMAAIVGLKGAGLPFALKYTIGAHNLDRIEEAVLNMVHLGPGFVEISLMTATPDNLRAGLALSPVQFREAEEVVKRLQSEFKTQIMMSAGTYSEHVFYGCASLCQIELYVDARGRLCFCCLLPGLRGSGPEAGSLDVIADLNEVSLIEAHKKLVRALSSFQLKRLERMARGDLAEIDHYACMSCARAFHKLDWLKDFPESPWNVGVLPRED